MKKYYEAYDKRYRQIHEMNLEWTSGNHLRVVEKGIAEDVPEFSMMMYAVLK